MSPLDTLSSAACMPRTSVGCRTARGEDMLAGQGAASFETWTGVGGMFDVMRGQL
mgnify:CR=1 FL=1